MSGRRPSAIGRGDGRACAREGVRMTVQPLPTEASARVAEARAIVERVPDPELVVVTLGGLGIVRGVSLALDGTLEVTLTPTYSGCPAVERIEDDVLHALAGAGLGPAQVSWQRLPAWSSDWLSDEARARLAAAGIAPPGAAADREGGPHAGAPRPAPLLFHPRPAPRLACPRCGSTDTERLAAFGATACKALHRCRACGEPFEHFKPI